MAHRCRADDEAGHDCGLPDLHPRLQCRRAGQHRRIAGCPTPRLGHASGDDPSRDRRVRVVVAGAGRNRCRPDLESRAHPPQHDHREVVATGQRSRPGSTDRPGPGSADPQAGSIRTRHVLPPQRPNQVGDETERPRGLTGVLVLDGGPAARRCALVPHR